MAKKDDFSTNNQALKMIMGTKGAVASDAETRSNPERTTKETPMKTTASAATITPPAGHKVNPLFIETKTRRLQLLMQPSLYNDIQSIAKAEGVSINEMAHILLKEAINART